MSSGPPSTTKTFLTTEEIARALETSRTTVARWVEAGQLPGHKTLGGHRRVKRADLLRFLQAHQMPIPHGLMARVRVLVIDDEPRFLGNLAIVLGRSDPRLDVEIAENGADGLLKVGLHRPHVVLIDAGMEGIDGFDVCKRMKKADETRGIYVIGISGSAANDARFRKAGAEGFLLKPLRAADVLTLFGALELIELAIDGVS